MLGVAAEVDAHVATRGLGARAGARPRLALGLPRTALIAAAAVIPIAARVRAVRAALEQPRGAARGRGLAAAAIANGVARAGDVTGASVLRVGRKLDAIAATRRCARRAAHAIEGQARDLWLVRVPAGEGEHAGGQQE